MDNAKQHWPILGKLGTELENKVRSFLVIGINGEGMIVATDDGLGYWLGTMQFDRGQESRTTTNPIPLDVPELVSIAQGCNYILLLNKRGKIYSIGKNNEGQLGLGTINQETYFFPQLISIPHKFISVRCGQQHSLALTEDGYVWAWGLNDSSQAGVHNSTNSLSSPRQILELDHRRVVAVECGGLHSLALTDQGEVYGWGKNDRGQLGERSKSFPHTPTRISTPSPVKSIAASFDHTLLLTRTGKVYACGDNGCGQLGITTAIRSSFRLSKVAGLPRISQIASHPLVHISIAMSHQHRCFVWGHIRSRTSFFTPMELSHNYSTVKSPLASFSPHGSTPHSVTLPGKKCSSRTKPALQTEPCSDSVQTQTSTYRILDQMFNNPESNPDVRFQMRDQTILAHRFVLQISSGHFRRLFSSRFTNLSSPSSNSVSLSSQSGSNRSRHTTNPSELKPDTSSHCLQVTISIPDHSYPAFHAYLRFLYLGILEVSPEHLADLFSLSVAYLESDLQQLCILRMRTTLSPATCCIYYQLINQNSLPEFDAFQQELVHFISTKFQEIIRTSAYQSMDDGLCKKLTISMANLHIN